MKGGHTMKTISYLRVSTQGQDLDKNKADILAFCNQRDLGRVTFIEEKISGKVPWRERRIKEVIDSLSEGDSLVVSELSRLGRSMLEILDILNVARGKGVSVFAVKGNWQLDDSIQSKIIATVFAMASEIERDLLSQRVKEALRVKKENGVKLGRPPGPGKSKLDPHREKIVELLGYGVPKTRVAEMHGCSTPNLYNWIEKNQIII